MKELLLLLSQLSRLEPLLALMTAAQPGQAYEVGDSLEVQPDGDDQLLMLKDGQRSPLFRSRLTGDCIVFEQVAPAMAIPESLTMWMRLLGNGLKGAPIALGGRIRDEELARRMDTLDHAWCVLNHMRRISDTEFKERAEMVLTLARDIRVARDTIFELENTSTASASQIKRAQLQMEAATADLAEARARLAGHAELKLCDDPRGASLKLSVDGVKGFDLYLTGINPNWIPANDFEWHAKPGAKARPVATAAPSSGPRAISSTHIAPEVQEVLQTAVAKGCELKLTQQLEPSTYAKVKRFIESLGGVWSSRRQVHVFDRDAESIMAEALGGTVVTDRDWDFYPTPPELVTRMLSKVQLHKGMRALEPQAGRGAIASCLAEVLGIENVDCVEAMPNNAQALRSMGFNVREADFLSLKPEPVYSVICMNPPFAGMRDIDHITHAMKFLAPDGILVSYASGSWRGRDASRAKAFEALLRRHGGVVEEVPAGAFRASGTEVSTVLLTIDSPAVAAIDRASAPRINAMLPQRMPVEHLQMDMFAA